ncbi:MAG TPA: glycine--tRNA ligase [Erysipelothrix sp.]|nr:glycine--tRNA ligase [Erysipelothrix sp.]
MSKVSFETISTHLRQTGFIYQGSQIYGGLSNTWDFGPLGVELKQNVKNMWWKRFIQQMPQNVGIQSAILMNPKVWQASGHLDTFADPLMDCKSCKARHRADNLIEDTIENIDASSLTLSEMEKIIEEHNIKCPNCGKQDFTNIRQFNLMFKTFQGVTEESTNTIYLRPETAQGMFVNFKNVQRTSRMKIPFGIGQIGKAFRNEITPGQLIFRTREFEQMELEFFCKPGTDLEWYDFYVDKCMNFLVELGLKRENLRLRHHSEEELSHYSVATVDIEYLFPWGWGELWGIADRTDFDLKQHQEHSKENMEYLDPETNERYIPYCVEPSVGVERLMLALMCDSYEDEQLENDSRTVMRLDPKVAPVKACVMPLSKKLRDNAMEVYALLAEHFNIEYDESGSIGRRYRRQDQVGTPFCITVDFDTLDDNAVTLRDRDTMQQERISIDQLVEKLNNLIK